MITENIVRNNGDKGISVGEASNIYLKSNIFDGNNKSIAVKDGSELFLDENSFLSSDSIIYLYKKKGFYEIPKVVISKESKNAIKFDISNDGKIQQVDNPLNSFHILN